MTSYEATFPAGVYSEQFENSYVYYCPDVHQSIVPVTYGYVGDYYYNPVFDDFEEGPFAIYYVPLVYYIPVYQVPVIYSFDDVHSYSFDDVHSYSFDEVHSYSFDDDHSQCYSAAHDVNNFSTFEYPTSEPSDGILGNYSGISEECSTFEIFYEEEGEVLNEAHFNDDDKRQNTEDDNEQNHDDKNLTSDSEESNYSSSDESIYDKREGNLTKFGNCLDLSLIDGGYRSDSYENSDEDDEALDVHSTVRYCRKSASYNTKVRLKTAIDESDEEKYSSQESDLNKNEDTEIKRSENVFDLSVGDDNDQRPQKYSRSSETGTLHEIIPGRLNEEISKSRSQRLKEKIEASKEYRDIQENLEYSEHYRNWLYKLALKKNPRRNNDILLDYLPPLIEEELVPLQEEDENRDDVSSHSSENVSINKDDGSKKENKQQKKRFKSVRKFLSRIFCCSASNQPP